MAYENYRDNPQIQVDFDGDVQLTKEQEDLILKLWNNNKNSPPSIEDLQKSCFGECYDHRKSPSLAIRKFLSSRDIVINKKEIKERESIKLTKEQEEYIVNHLKDDGPLTVARDLFRNPKIGNLHSEFRAIDNFIKSQDPRIFGTVEQEDYHPPRRLEHMAARVNRAIADETIDNKCWEKNNTIKQYLESGIRFCHHHRFVLLASRCTDIIKRNYFENSYVSYVWNKPDLTAEELDLYIDVSQSMVQEMELDDQIILYSNYLEGATDDADGKKTSLSISEHLAGIRKEKGEIQKRRKDLIGVLQGKRSDRIDQKRKENASILNLVEAWRNEGKRKEMIEGRKKEKERLNDEIDRLNNLDAVKALIAGIDVRDLLA